MGGKQRRSEIHAHTASRGTVVAAGILLLGLTVPGHFLTASLQAAPVGPSREALPPGAVGRFGSKRLSHPGAIRSFAFSPDGATLGVISYGGTVGLWPWAHPDRPPVLRRLGPRAPGPPGPQAHGLAFSPSGRVLAVGVDAAVILLDGSTLRTRWRAPLEGAWGCLRFTPDGKVLAAANADGALCLLDAATGKMTRRVTRTHLTKKGKPAAVIGLAVSPDGRLLATASVRDDALTIWELPTLRPRRTILAEGGVNCLAFSPDGKTLVSGDSRLRGWDPATGKSLWARDYGRAIQSLAFSPDGRSLAIGAGLHKEVLVVGFPSREVSRRIHVPGPKDDLGNLSFSPDGRVLGWSGGWDSTVTLWDLARGRPLFPEPRHRGTVTALAASRDGRVLFTGGADGAIHAWQTRTGRHLRLVGRHEGSLTALDVSADGARLASAAHDCTIRLWDVDAARQILKFRCRDTAAESLALHEEGNELVATDGRMAAWCLSARTGRPRWEWWPEDFFAQGVAAPGGQVFATYHPHRAPIQYGEVIRLWRTRDRKELFCIKQPDTDRGTQAIAFIPDGEKLALAEDGAVRLFDLGTGKKVWEINLPEGEIYSLACSPSGKVLAVGYYDGRITLCEVASGQRLATWRAHDCPVWSLCFIPPGRLLASGAEDSTALLWDLAKPPLNGRGGRGHLEGARWWRDLGGADAAQARRALWALVDHPERAVALLRERLPPVAPVKEGQFNRLLARLDSDDFAGREAASMALERLGERVAPDLRRVLRKKDLGPEARRRIEVVLRNLKHRPRPATQLRVVRAIEALEYIGTPEARRRLESLAKGASAALETQEARAALRRLGRP
jgi:WD40 repeat protein